MKNAYFLAALLVTFLGVHGVSFGEPDSQQTINGEYLIAYRVAATAFFKTTSLEACEERLHHYDIMFSSSGDNIQITFMTPCVDYAKMKDSKEYAEEVIRKGREGTTVVVIKKEMTVLSIHKNR